MFSYSKGSRSYAKRFIIIFTDGLMVLSPELKTEVGNLLGYPNMIVSSVGIGSSVKHDHLEQISTDINTILRPSAHNIWNYIQKSLAVPGCLGTYNLAKCLYCITFYALVYIVM